MLINLLQKMVSAYDEYAQKVGIIPPEYNGEQKKTIEEKILKSNMTESEAVIPTEQ